jgi:hypothetical protein
VYNALNLMQGVQSAAYISICHLMNKTGDIVAHLDRLVQMYVFYAPIAQPYEDKTTRKHATGVVLYPLELLPQIEAGYETFATVVADLMVNGADGTLQSFAYTPFLPLPAGTVAVASIEPFLADIAAAHGVMATNALASGDATQVDEAGLVAYAAQLGQQAQEALNRGDTATAFALITQVESINAQLKGGASASS